VWIPIPFLFIALQQPAAIEPQRPPEPPAAPPQLEIEPGQPLPPQDPKPPVDKQTRDRLERLLQQWKKQKGGLPLNAFAPTPPSGRCSVRLREVPMEPPEPMPKAQSLGQGALMPKPNVPAPPCAPVIPAK
jgi:hypothetical protein